MSRFNDDPTISLRNDSFTISPKLVSSSINKQVEVQLNLNDFSKNLAPIKQPGSNQVAVASDASSFVVINNAEVENNFSHQSSNLQRSKTQYNSSNSKQPIMKEHEPYQI